jgi:cobalt-zinc-cadmium resistance protein CzcA
MEIKNQELLKDYYQRLKGSALTLPQAGFTFETGQINSAYTDTKLSISQTIQFPTVYTHQKNLLKDEWDAAIIGIALTKKQIKKAVTQMYYHILILKEKERLLLYSDSIYSVFSNKAKMRFQKGESNIIEKNSAEAERGKITLQLHAIHNDIELQVLRFQLLLHTQTIYTPEQQSLYDFPSLFKDTTEFQNHPLLKLYQANIQKAQTNLSLEKAKFLPELSIGISNQSIQGIGADNVSYPASQRFNAISVGIGIPHIFGAQSSIIEASETQIKIAEHQLLSEQEKLYHDIQSSFATYQTDSISLEFLQKHQLPLIPEIKNAAEKQYASGEIDFFQWVLLQNQAITIQNNYLDMLNELHSIVSHIQYILAQ